MPSIDTVKSAKDCTVKPRSHISSAISHRSSRANDRVVTRWLHHHTALWLARLQQGCIICAQPHQRSSMLDLICQHCQSLITLLPPIVKIPLDPTVSSDAASSHVRLFSLSYYQYPLNHLIQNFKDHEDLQALLALYAVLAKLPKPVGCTAKDTVILPIPTTRSRIQQRGFNPVLILAKFLSWHWQLPLWQGLARRDGMRHQRGLNRSERLVNTQSDFYLIDAVPMRQVIIFDDVVTTGSTVASAAKLLLADSPQLRLIAVCLAHGRADFGLNRA